MRRLDTVVATELAANLRVLSGRGEGDDKAMGTLEPMNDEVVEIPWGPRKVVRATVREGLWSTMAVAVCWCS